MWLAKSRRLLDWAVVKFMIVGVANTFFGLVVIFIAKWMFGLGDVLANVLGYSCGLVLSYTLNLRWSFAYEGNAMPAIIRFVAVIAVAYGVNLALVLGSINLLEMNSYMSQAIGILPYTAISYLGFRYLVFPITACSQTTQNKKYKG